MGTRDEDVSDYVEAVLEYIQEKQDELYTKDARKIFRA